MQASRTSRSAHLTAVLALVTLLGGLAPAVASEPTVASEGPNVSWTTEDGAMFLRLWFPFSPVSYSNSILEGSATDPGLAPIQFVYVWGYNLDSGERFGRTASLASRPFPETDWTLRIVLSPGEWELSAYAQNEDGDVGPTERIMVTVHGGV